MELKQKTQEQHDYFIKNGHSDLFSSDKTLLIIHWYCDEKMSSKHTLAFLLIGQ